jgi:hypothetical protein
MVPGRIDIQTSRDVIHVTALVVAACSERTAVYRRRSGGRWIASRALLVAGLMSKNGHVYADMRLVLPTLSPGFTPASLFPAECRFQSVGHITRTNTDFGPSLRRAISLDKREVVRDAL